MRSSRRIVSNNHLSQHDNTVAEAAKKRQEEKFMQHLSIQQANLVGQVQLRKRSTRAYIEKRNSGSQILMPEPDSTPDTNGQVITIAEYLCLD
jgi:hypothetical protein